MSAVDPGSTLGMSVSEYFDTGLYSDLRIKDSNGHEYAVHRIVVCGQSTVLAKACKPEHGFKEAQTGVIDLKHDDPGAVAAMLEFMYRGCFTISDLDNAILENARAYAMGEIYCVQDLKDFSSAEFKRLSDTDWDTDNFVDAARVIYDSVPDTDTGGIRDIISSVIAEHYHKLLTKAKFEAALDDFGELGKDVLRVLAKVKATPQKRKYACPGTTKRGLFCGHYVELDVDPKQRNASTFCPSCGQRYLNREWVGYRFS